MPLLKRLTWFLAFATVAGIAAVIAFVPNPGRAAVAVLAAGSFGWFVMARIAHSRYTAVLKQAAGELGLACLTSGAEERGSAILERMRVTSEADVFRWKVDGRLPAIVGEYEGFAVTVRVPVGVAFDAGAPDSTRIVAYHNVKMTGFTIYDRSKVRKPPAGRQVLLDEPEFDRRFLVLAHRPDEALAVLSPEVRAALLESGGTGFRGIEVNRYGVFLHEEGKVSSAELVKERLDLVVRLAKAARELGGLRGAGS